MSQKSILSFFPKKGASETLSNAKRGASVTLSNGSSGQPKSSKKRNSDVLEEVESPAKKITKEEDCKSNVKNYEEELSVECHQNGTAIVDEDSPVKRNPGCRRRVQIIDSEDEDEESDQIVSSDDENENVSNMKAKSSASFDKEMFKTTPVKGIKSLRMFSYQEKKEIGNESANSQSNDESINSKTFDTTEDKSPDKADKKSHKESVCDANKSSIEDTIDTQNCNADSINDLNSLSEAVSPSQKNLPALRKTARKCVSEKNATENKQLEHIEKVTEMKTGKVEEKTENPISTTPNTFHSVFSKPSKPSNSEMKQDSKKEKRKHSKKSTAKKSKTKEVPNLKSEMVNSNQSATDSQTPSDTKDYESPPTKLKEEIASPKSTIINPFNNKGSGHSTKDGGVSYNPAKKSYHPIEDASWKKGESMPYLALAKTLELIEGISGRLKTIEILANLLRSVIVLSPEDLLHTIYLCLNKVAPAFQGIELGVGESFLIKTIAQATGRSTKQIKSDSIELGDLGIVAERSKSTQRMMFKPAILTVKAVFERLKEISLMSGNDVQSKKIDKIKAMFVACRQSEARYLIRSLGGKLRIGLAEQSVLQAIGQACFLTPTTQSYPPDIMDASKGLSAETIKGKIDEASLLVKTTYCECPSYDRIVPILLSEGLDALPKHCQLEPGIPLKPMLAHPTKGVAEVLKRFENAKFTCEYKYDGERAQIHLKEDNSIHIYSRNQEDNTSKYPDIISRLKESLGPDIKSCILDSEAVAYDLQEDKILPFQILSTRKRKDAVESDIKVQVCVFPFDLLYLNGKNLVREPFEARRKLLKENFVEVDKKFMFAKSMDSINTEDIEEFLDESIKHNCEGLMVKTLEVEATYEIARRSHNWLKLKKDYLEGVGDTIDVVVIGGFLGKGKRAGTYGGFLLACYDNETEDFQSICKIGTGFTEETLQTHTSFFKEHILDNPKSYYVYDSSLNPDHWFDAIQVWEIKCADLSISPVHKAAIGIVDPEKGISLRFPRYLRVRNDKSPEEATTAAQIAEMYKNQDQIKNQTSTKTEEDFY